MSAAPSDPARVADDEDVERNAIQAAHNARMRDLLRDRRQRLKKETSEASLARESEDFMGVDDARASVGASLEEPPPPWFVPRPHIENPVLRLHEELIDFADFMKHGPEEVKARRKWVATIKRACRALWQNCKVSVFGSFFTGLSLPNGDVDVAVLDVPCSPATAMKALAEHMLAAGEISCLEIIEFAKVPVVKLRSQACGLRADVVFNQPDGINTSRFIRERVQDFPQMKPLLIFLKYFLLQRGLHETYTGGMGSYLLCNIVLHFVQRHPSRRNQHHYRATSLGHLLYDLLRYYGNEFRYDSQGISVLGVGRLFDKAQRGWKGRGKGKCGMALALESPLDPQTDLGAGCFRIGVLRNLFDHAFHCICHLFVSKATPEASLLCPLLLTPAHPVITDRHRLMAEQPVALPGLPHTSARESEQERELRTKEAIDGSPDDQDKSERGGPPPTKRRRLRGATAVCEERGIVRGAVDSNRANRPQAAETSGVNEGTCINVDDDEREELRTAEGTVALEREGQDADEVVISGGTWTTERS